MRPEVRVFRWREIARITLSQFAGNLDSILRRPYAEAREPQGTSHDRRPGCGEDLALLRSGLGLTPGVERLACVSTSWLGADTRITEPPTVPSGLRWSPSFRQVRTGSRRHIFCCENMERPYARIRHHYAISVPPRADVITLQSRCFPSHCVLLEIIRGSKASSPPPYARKANLLRN